MFFLCNKIYFLNIFMGAFQRVNLLGNLDFLEWFADKEKLLDEKREEVKKRVQEITENSEIHCMDWRWLEPWIHTAWWEMWVLVSTLATLTKLWKNRRQKKKAIKKLINHHFEGWVTYHSADSHCDCDCHTWCWHLKLVHENLEKYWLKEEDWDLIQKEIDSHKQTGEVTKLSWAHNEKWVLVFKNDFTIKPNGVTEWWTQNFVVSDWYMTKNMLPEIWKIISPRNSIQATKELLKVHREHLNKTAWELAKDLPVFEIWTTESWKNYITHSGVVWWNPAKDGKGKNVEWDYQPWAMTQLLEINNSHKPNKMA